MPLWNTWPVRSHAKYYDVDGSPTAIEGVKQAGEDSPLAGMTKYAFTDRHLVLVATILGQWSRLPYLDDEHVLTGDKQGMVNDLNAFFNPMKADIGLGVERQWKSITKMKAWAFVVIPLITNEFSSMCQCSRASLVCNWTGLTYNYKFVWTTSSSSLWIQNSWMRLALLRSSRLLW